MSYHDDRPAGPAVHTSELAVSSHGTRSFSSRHCRHTLVVPLPSATSQGGREREREREANETSHACRGGRAVVIDSKQSYCRAFTASLRHTHSPTPSHQHTHSALLPRCRLSESFFNAAGFHLRLPLAPGIWLFGTLARSIDRP
jgi:hypothetical protein